MRRLRIVVLVALASLVGSVASAQQASIVGTAMDESKAVLPGVNVTATRAAPSSHTMDTATLRGR